MIYRFLAEAKDDLFVSAEFYENRQPGLGRRFQLEFDEALARILSDAESYPKIKAEIRSAKLKRFPFQIIFRVRDDTVEICAIAHHSRRPGYWMHRLPDAGHEG